jgi:hypothetical protein
MPQEFAAPYLNAPSLTYVHFTAAKKGDKKGKATAAAKSALKGV